MIIIKVLILMSASVASPVARIIPRLKNEEYDIENTQQDVNANVKGRILARFSFVVSSPHVEP